MKKKMCFMLLLFLGMLLIGCAGHNSVPAKEFSTQPLTDHGWEMEEVTVTIPGLSQTYHFLYLSDLHIIKENEQVSEENLENVRARIAWSSVEGTPAAECWPGIVAELDSCEADLVLFGGDMIDFCSSANVECLKEGLEQMTTPYLYVRADHDYCPFYCEGVSEKACKTLHAELDGDREIWCVDYPEFCVVGLSNSTSQLSEDGWKELKNIFDKDKPVVLLTHVPYNSVLPTDLADQSRAVWGDRALIWGSGCYYEPNVTTGKLLDRIYAEDSPVKEILCGHLHFTWDGYLTENTHQHVFSAAYDKKIGIITVTGE